jgi:GNAT superfamily N-acetyltransferase
MIQVGTAVGQRGLREFLEVAPPLYRGIDGWVRPLDQQLRSRLDRKREPFWQHAEGELLLAHRHGKPAGRLLIMHDRLLVEKMGEKVATFGLFEAPVDKEITTALFAAAEEWARGRGLVGLLGPLFLSIHDEVGLLVDGFDRKPRMLMPYGREYYPELLLQTGFAPVREYHAYEWNIQSQTVPHPLPLPEGMVIRPFDRRRQREEIRNFLLVYNESFSGNWGFVPMTEAEAEAVVGDFLAYADLALPQFAEKGGEPVGFIIALPDLNEVIANCGGKLWPFGLPRLLLGRRRIRNVRVVTLAVRRPFRPSGVAHHLIHRLWEVGRARGYRTAEFGYIEAGNKVMQAIVERIGARKVKTYHLYRKDMGAS